MQTQRAHTKCSPPCRIFHVSVVTVSASMEGGAVLTALLLPLLSLRICVSGISSGVALPISANSNLLGHTKQQCQSEVVQESNPLYL